MGKAIIPGGGGGAPRNSVKVLEYAGEDIPANYFVSKKEGANASAQRYSFKSNYSIKATIPIKDDEYICVMTQQTAENIVYMRGLVEVSSVQATHSDVLSQKSISIVHLKDAQKILYLFKSGSYNYKVHYAVIVSYDEQGNLSLEQIQSNINAEDDSTYTREFVSGDYSNGYLYAIVCSGIYNTSTSYLEKWKLDSTNTLVFVSSKSINKGLIYYQNNAGTPVYIEEVNRIYFLNYSYKLSQLNPETLEYSIDSEFPSGVQYSLTGLACYKGTYLLDKKRNVLWVTSELYSANDIDLYCINIEKFTYSVLMTSVASGSLCPMSFDEYDVPKSFIYAYNSNNLLKIDIENKKVIFKENLPVLSNYVRGLCICSKGALKYYLWEDNNRYSINFNLYYLGKLTLPEANDPIYGLSFKKINEGESDFIHVLSNTQNQSVHGIPQELADAIVDDGIIEVQNEVLSGKEQNNG